MESIKRAVLTIRINICTIKGHEFQEFGWVYKNIKTNTNEA